MVVRIGRIPKFALAPPYDCCPRATAQKPAVHRGKAGGDRASWPCYLLTHAKSFQEIALLSPQFHTNRDRTRALVPMWSSGSGDSMSGKVGWPLGKSRSEETRQKMSEQMRKRWTDPAYRARQATVPHCARAKRPPRGTPERRYYEKVRESLGPRAAEEALRAML
jgi:NUMOD3 motif